MHHHKHIKYQETHITGARLSGMRFKSRAPLTAEWLLNCGFLQNSNMITFLEDVGLKRTTTTNKRSE